MAYVINVSFANLGAFAATPFFNGSMFFPPPSSGTTPSLVATATSSGTSTPTTLTFGPVVSAPPDAGAVLLTNAAGGGDLLRSGVYAPLPASPASAAVIALPPTVVPPTTITGAAGGATTPPTGFLTEDKVLAGLVSGGLFVPISSSVTGINVALGKNSFTLTVKGTLVVHQFYFFNVTHNFTLTVTITPGPSADPTDRSRILAMTPSAPTLEATGVPGFVSSVVVSSLASTVASKFESAVNTAILVAATGAVGMLGKELTDTSAICADAVSVSPMAGMTLGLAISDLTGPGWRDAPGNLAVSLSPTPVEGKAETLTVTVTNSATGNPVQGAAVTISNFSSVGNATTIQLPVTDINGQTPPTVVTLRTKTTVVTGNQDGPLKDHVTTPPAITVSKAGFNTVTFTLFDTP